MDVPVSTTQAAATRQKPRLLFVITEDWYFLMHRLVTATAARDAGFDVHVACNVTKDGDAIVQKGFSLHPVDFNRGRISLLGLIRTVIELRRAVRAVQPQITHHVSLQPIVQASVASLGKSTPSVNAFTGLGFTFTSNKLGPRMVRGLLTRLFPLLLNRRMVVVTVENPDDARRLAELGVAPERIVVVPGSGVDVERFHPNPEPAGPPVVAFAGRLIEIKGIRTLVDAHRILRSRGCKIVLLIAGAPDPANPSSIPPEEVASWEREPGITYLGHVEDIATVWARAAIAVLPSYGGEGVPMALLEAGAMGRPLIATDVPGSRELVIPGETGLLVPVGNAAALADAIQKLATAAALRAQYGSAARARIVENFSATIVGRKMVEVYATLLNQTPLRSKQPG